MFDNTTNVSSSFGTSGAKSDALSLPSPNLSLNPLELSESSELAQSLPIVAAVEPSALGALPITFEPNVRSGEELAAELGVKSEEELAAAERLESLDKGFDVLLNGGSAGLEASSEESGGAIAFESIVESDAVSSTGSSTFEDVVGTFVVGSSGQVEINFLFDGGGYEGQLAVFSLEGMAGLSQSEFVQEAARRVLSNSADGQIVISDAAEGAQFSGELGEADINSGEAASTKTLSLVAGSRFAVMLVPNGTVAQVAAGEQVPFFSIAAFNPNGQAQIGKAAEGVFAFEDLLIGQGDSDFNDLIFQVTGATSNVTDLADLINPSRNWLNSPVAQPFLKEPTFSEDSPNQPTEAPPQEPVAPPTNPPVTEPPVAEPPVAEPPAEEPPAEVPPAEEPPAEEPPAEEQPVEPPVEQPVEQPTTPPVEEPPAEEPPAPEPLLRKHRPLRPR